jgi:hypothetical protein
MGLAQVILMTASRWRPRITEDRNDRYTADTVNSVLTADGQQSLL